MTTTKTLSDAIGEARYKRMQQDPCLFVRAFETLTPWQYQEDYLRTALERKPDGKFKNRIVVISLPRQNSKTTISAWIALWRLYCGEGQQQIVSVANDTEQAEILLGDAHRIISASDTLYSLLDQYGLNRAEIRLANGNRWIIKSSESIASRGLRPSLVCYDELGWASDRSLFDVLSSGQAAQPNPLTVVTSTVGPVKDGILWELFELARANNPIVCLIYSSENQSPLITAEYLAAQQALLPAHVYAREHLNLWGEGSDALCSEADWKRAIADGDPRRIDDPGPCYAFLDLGWVHDESVLVIMRKLESGKNGVLCMETWQGTRSAPVEFTSIQARLHELCARFHVGKLRIEAPQGYQMAQQLALSGVPTEVLSPTAKSNQENWGALITSLKNGTVVLPDDAKLRRQLLTLTIKNTPTGWRVEDVPAIHNDRAVAVAGALYLIIVESMIPPYEIVWYQADDYRISDF
jgi:phage terminase large subunit-like protein